MVSSMVAENGETSPPKKSPSSVGIAPGNYCLVGWAMDTTGRRLIDEFCQIAGYTPSSSYFQYVMPHRNLDPTAIKRHNMKIVTIGRFRVLKSSKTNKVLKTKCDVSALTDFITWLESIKGDATDGLILLSHEPRKVIPPMLLESLKKYNLFDRFKQTVKGFVNGFNVAEAKCPITVQAYSLRTLSHTLLNTKKQMDNAQNRARLALQVVQHLSSMDTTKTVETNGCGDTDVAMKTTIEFVREFVQPIDVEEQEHTALKLVSDRELSLKPIFGSLFRHNRRVRQHVTPLRRLLAEAGIEYSQLQEAWSNGKKEGLEKFIKEKLSSAEEGNVVNILMVLEGHFAPEKKSKYERLPNKKEIRTENSKINDDKENNNKCDSGTESPDTTTTTTSSPVQVKAESSENGAVTTEN